MPTTLDLFPPGADRNGNAFDEMVTGQGLVRPHWRSLVSTLGALGIDGLRDRGARGIQYLEDEGVAYNLYELPEPRERGPGFAPPIPRQRPWQLDPVPLILSADEWATIEAGLLQRAELLDLVLRDLYGPMRLLHERRYPPALAFANRNFFRPARMPEQAGRRLLQHYAADLVRGPDGQWRVVADRTQSPAGAGYALQNRRVMSRIMAQAIRTARVRPLASFFEYWQSDLQGRANLASDNPRLAVWTPGPYNEAYLEHIYLARELGATLVEGADLTMRPGGIFLKTMQGLEPIDVILRRNDGEWCDPLELRADSRIGVPGLLQAIRLQQVAVCNAIGTGLVETAALQAFLPTLCQHLLGEPLRLPSVATWWCGQRGPREEAMRNLDRLTVRAALDIKQAPIVVAELDDAARQALEDAIMARPAEYAAQEMIDPSLAPCLGPGGLIPKPVLLRVHVVADADRYVAMPGGLALVTTREDACRASLQRGGISKDVWVTTDEPFNTVVRGPAERARLGIVRTSGTLQSRVADDLYWLGRHVERLDNGARLLRAGLSRFVGEFALPREMFEFRTIAQTVAACGFIDAQAAAAPLDSSIPGEAMLRIFAPGGALAGSLQEIKRLVVQVRHRFSADMWRLFNHLLGELAAVQPSAGTDADDTIELCDQIIRATAAIGGIFAEHMTRGSGWRFLDLGRRVERGVHVTRVLRSTSRAFATNADLGYRLTLELNDSALTYRRRYRAALQAAPALDLVLLDGGNPQSLAYQVERIGEHLQNLPGPLRTEAAATCRAIMEPLQALVARLAEDGDPGVRWRTVAGELESAIEQAGERLMQLSDRISRTYFSHTPIARAFGVGE